LNPTVAIVILNWNGRSFLEQFLPSVLASTYSPLEVIVADNGSTDDSITFLQQHFPAVRIITLGSNMGFAKGYNEALRQVDSTYWVLLNSDVEVSPGWLEPMVQLMVRNPQAGACQPKIRMERDRTHFEYAGACGGWLDHLGYPFARGRIFDICEADQGQYEDEAPVFWASGAALMVRAEAFHIAGGLDEYFFAHQEEIDFCWRLQLNGYSVWVCPSSVVYHVGGGTLPKGNKRKVFLNFRNNLIMLCKNLPAGALVWTLPVRVALDAISAWKSLLAGEGTYFMAVMKAHFSFAKWLLMDWNQSIFPKNKKGPLQGWFKGSIVYRHFVCGKTKFSEIVHNKGV
jgi:GT2 family glycosyltransferase